MLVLEGRRPSSRVCEGFLLDDVSAGAVLPRLEICGAGGRGDALEAQTAPDRQAASEGAGPRGRGRGRGCWLTPLRGHCPDASQSRGAACWVEAALSTRFSRSGFRFPPLSSFP